MASRVYGEYIRVLRRRRSIIFISVSQINYVIKRDNNVFSHFKSFSFFADGNLIYHLPLLPEIRCYGQTRQVFEIFKNVLESQYYFRLHDICIHTYIIKLNRSPHIR